jgi:hypothetical protein
MSDPLNPYAPPQAADRLRTEASGVLLNDPRPYVSARGKSRALVIASGFTIFLQVLLLGSFVLQLIMLSAAQSGGGIDTATAEANDTRHMIVGVAALLGALTCLVLLLVWVYAVHANLPSLKPARLEFSHGWAVGWFFVPIANLVKPYQVVREIWTSSDPSPLLGIAPAGTALLGWWWGLRIASAVAERALSSVSEHQNTIEGLITASWLAIILISLLDVPMFLCQIFLVGKVQQSQDERHALLTRQQAAAQLPGSNPFAAFE